MSTPARIIILSGLPLSSVGRLAAMLARQPERVLLPELNLHLAPSIGALLNLFSRSQDHLGDGLFRAVAAVRFGGQNADDINAARDWLWRHAEWPSSVLLERFQAWLAPGQLIIPDTHLGWRPDYLARLEALSDLALVHLHRHPVTHAQTLVEHFRQRQFIPPDYMDFCANPAGQLDPQIAWFRFHTNLRRWAERTTAPYYPVALEQLQARPRQTLRDLNRVLGSNTRSVPVLQPQASPFLQQGPHNAPWGMEIDVIRSPALELQLERRPALHPAAADWRPDRRLCREVRDLAADLGYPAT